MSLTKEQFEMALRTLAAYAEGAIAADELYTPVILQIAEEAMYELAKKGIIPVIRPGDNGDENHQREIVKDLKRMILDLEERLCQPPQGQ